MMRLTGGCYCGAVRYEAAGDVQAKGMCFCRECQYIAGGGANVVIGMPEKDFTYVKVQPQSFARNDLEAPAIREFCPTCGTHLVTRSPRARGLVLIKVGTLDDPALFGMPQVAVYTQEKQVYHVVPEGVPSFSKRPGKPD